MAAANSVLISSWCAVYVMHGVISSGVANGGRVHTVVVLANAIKYL